MKERERQLIEHLEKFYKGYKVLNIDDKGMNCFDVVLEFYDFEKAKEYDTHCYIVLQGIWHILGGFEFVGVKTYKTQEEFLKELE